MVLPANACDISSVTLQNETAEDVLFEGGYTVPASATLVIDFTTMSCWKQRAMRTACETAHAAGDAVTINSFT